MTAFEWNAKYPVGTSVCYQPIKGIFGKVHYTKTRSQAWELGSGEPVVLLEGFAGGKALWALTVDGEAQEGGQS